MNEVMMILAFAQTVTEMIAAGKTTGARLRDILQQEGATPEQLATLDARLTAAISAREAERGGDPTQ